jgi:hypothetical protein
MAEIEKHRWSEDLIISFLAMGGRDKVLNKFGVYLSKSISYFPQNLSIYSFCFPFLTKLVFVSLI